MNTRLHHSATPYWRRGLSPQCRAHLDGAGHDLRCRNCDDRVEQARHYVLIYKGLGSVRRGYLIIGVRRYTPNSGTHFSNWVRRRPVNVRPLKNAGRHSGIIPHTGIVPEFWTRSPGKPIRAAREYGKLFLMTREPGGDDRPVRYTVLSRRAIAVWAVLIVAAGGWDSGVAAAGLRRQW